MKIGLTMRVVWAPGYDEARDALAQNWMSFLKHAMPDVAWLPVPNFGSDVAVYAKQWGLQGFILTGGNDIGEAPIGGINTVIDIS